MFVLPLLPTPLEEQKKGVLSWDSRWEWKENEKILLFFNKPSEFGDVGVLVLIKKISLCVFYEV